jgi:hypothetical protein
VSASVHSFSGLGPDASRTFSLFILTPYPLGAASASAPSFFCDTQ